MVWGASTCIVWRIATYGHSPLHACALLQHYIEAATFSTPLSAAIMLTMKMWKSADSIICSSVPLLPEILPSLSQMMILALFCFKGKACPALLPSPPTCAHTTMWSRFWRLPWPLDFNNQKERDQSCLDASAKDILQAILKLENNSIFYFTSSITCYRSWHPKISYHTMITWLSVAHAMSRYSSCLSILVAHLLLLAHLPAINMGPLYIK